LAKWSHTSAIKRLMRVALSFASALSAILSICPSAPAQYAGSQACRSCHLHQFEQQSRSEHAHALALAPPGSPGHWAFGAGVKAITYVSQVSTEWYIEHGLSYYAATKSMALTPGHSNAEGMRYRTFDPGASILRCFRCHSTGPLRLAENWSVAPSELGVYCESCHGPGEVHVASRGKAGTIQNPGRFKAGELNMFCGTCHRKPPEEGEETDWSNSWNTRHQPDYLSQAVCFRKSNGALSCLTCHDPHSPLARRAAEYNNRCATCHQSVRHRSDIVGQACVDCHMPQVAMSRQLSFTNHWIGIYAKGSSLIPRPSAVKDLLPLRLAVAVSGQVSSPADPVTLKPLFEKALIELEKQFGSSSPKVARSASDLGLFLETLKDPVAAVGPLTKALTVDRANSDPELPLDQERLGIVLLASGKRQEAYDLFRSAAQGPNAGVAARSLIELAILDAPNAEAYYRLALLQEEKSSDKESPRVAIVLNDLGLTLRQKGDNSTAEPLFRRALAIQEKALGPNHTATASTLNNLGSLLQSIGRFDEAERVERRALGIFEEKLGPQSMELAITCANLADLMWAKHDRVAAANLYRRALSIDESVYGPGDPEVAMDLTNLGLLLKESGESAAASASLHRALEIYEKAYGPQSPQALKLRKMLTSNGIP
jgi:tetratricopeptide (TPR) repeat protein